MLPVQSPNTTAMQAMVDSSPPAAATSEMPTLSGFQFDLPPPPRRATFGRVPLKNQVKPCKSGESLVSGQQDTTGPFELPANSIKTLPTGSEARTSESSSNNRTTINSAASSSTGRATSGSATSTTPTSPSTSPLESASNGEACIPSPINRFPRQGPSITGSSEAEKHFDSSGSAAAYSAKVSLQRVLSGSNNSSKSITSQVKPKPLLDALSHETFLEALENPPVRHRLHQFTQPSLCCDYISFLDQVAYHRKMVENSTKIMSEIDSLYLSPESQSHIHMSSPTNEALRADISTVVKETYPNVGSVFSSAEDAVQNAIFDHVYEDFVRTQLTLSASEALSNDRHRYQGLGDCFCLTEPSKADNPIMFASDGFVAVTGYERTEIIPRNCRFLQGKQTDSHAARRIGSAVQKRKESVEFLLNYRKNGEPFWNLLYTAPLIDSTGHVAFFLGGQVNCSSSIHSKPDIMRVLAAMPDHEREKAELEEKKEDRNAPGKILARRLEQAKTLKYREKAAVEKEPGVERRLVASNQALKSSQRIQRFYNAYSKYLVAKYPAMDIHFTSSGVGEVLNATPVSPIGVNAFKFLRQQMLSRDKSDWKHRIEVALKAGRPISLALHLRTKRSAVFRGDEKYLTHWTPLKDLEGRTQWVIVCLCPTLH